MMVLMCDHWPLELAVNGHWYGALVVRRLKRLLKLVGGGGGGCHFHLRCEAADVSMHQHPLLWGPPMTPGSLAAGGFPAGSLITPSGIWLHWC